MGKHEQPDRELHAGERSIHGDTTHEAMIDAEGAAAAAANPLGNAPGGSQQSNMQLKTKTEQAQRTTAKPTSMRSKKGNQPSGNP